MKVVPLHPPLSIWSLQGPNWWIHWEYDGDPGVLQSMGSQRVRHNLATKQTNKKLWEQDPFTLISQWRWHWLLHTPSPGPGRLKNGYIHIIKIDMKYIYDHVLGGVGRCWNFRSFHFVFTDKKPMWRLDQLLGVLIYDILWKPEKLSMGSFMDPMSHCETYLPQESIYHLTPYVYANRVAFCLWISVSS